MATQPPVDPTPTDPHPPAVPGGTQHSPASPGSGGERVIAFAVAGGMLAAVGLLFSTITASPWGELARGVIGLGAIVAAIGAFIGFSSGRKNAAVACGAVATAALVMLIFAILHMAGADGEEASPAVESPTMQENPPRPE